MLQKLKKIGKWIENYWYHYKSLTIVLGLVGLIAVFAVVNLATRPRYDMVVILSTYGQLPEKQAQALKVELEKFAPDLDGNGTVSIELRNIPIFNPTGINGLEISEEMSAQAVPDSGDIASRQRLYASLSDAAVVLLALDEPIYSLLYGQSPFADLSTRLGDAPCVRDDKLFLSGMPFTTGIADNEGLNQMFFCVRDPQTMPGNSQEAQKQYDAVIELLQGFLKANLGEPA